jgi:hypothetical protein
LTDLAVPGRPLPGHRGPERRPLANYLGDLPRPAGERLGLWAYLGPGAEDRDVGSLWFVAALLSFSLAYAAWRWARPAGNHSGTVMRPRQLPIAAAVIAAGSFAVWLVVVILGRGHPPRPPLARVAPGCGAVQLGGAVGRRWLAGLGAGGLVAPLQAGRGRRVAAVGLLVAGTDMA